MSIGADFPLNAYRPRKLMLFQETGETFRISAAPASSPILFGMVQFAGAQGNTSQDLSEAFCRAVQWVAREMGTKSVTLI
jgi:hypothetical protein